MKTHYKKIMPQYFNEVVNGNKTFELRANDCGYKKGDKLILQEIIIDIRTMSKTYTGNEIEKEISYVFKDELYGLESGYCILGLKPEGIKFINIDLSKISELEQLYKVKEENIEFDEALIFFLENRSIENRLHVIEEFWDKVQSSLGMLDKYEISADEVMKLYPLHLEKIKNRPR